MAAPKNKLSKIHNATTVSIKISYDIDSKSRGLVEIEDIDVKPGESFVTKDLKRVYDHQIEIEYLNGYVREFITVYLRWDPDHGWFYQNPSMKNISKLHITIENQYSWDPIIVIAECSEKN